MKSSPDGTHRAKTQDPLRPLNGGFFVGEKMAIALEVDSKVLNEVMGELKRLGNLKPALSEFHGRMSRETDLMFRKAGGSGSATRGGEYRGVRWEPYRKRYMNRKRPSGSRVTPSSLMLQDTGRLKQRATTEVVQVTPHSLVFGTRLRYAARQNAYRPFLFVTESDAEVFAKILYKHLQGKNV